MPPNSALAGRSTATPATISYTYIQLGDSIAEDQMRDLAQLRDRAVFCINDHVGATAAQHAAAAEWLAAFFPVASPFEKTS